MSLLGKLDVIILAGGKGSRLEQDLPKALINAKGKPILVHQLDYLLKFPLTNQIVLALGYRADKIREYINLNYDPSKIDFSVESEPLGTAGAIKKALYKAITDYVLVLNCDDLTDIDIASLTKSEENTICVAHPQLPFGRVIDREGYAFFEEKPILEDWVSCGWYFFNRAELLARLPDKGSLEYDVFPNLKLRVYKHGGFWKTINTNKDLIEFEAAELPPAPKKYWGFYETC